MEIFLYIAGLWTACSLLTATGLSVLARRKRDFPVKRPPVAPRPIAPRSIRTQV
jgi:hypothetical protein